MPRQPRTCPGGAGRSLHRRHWRRPGLLTLASHLTASSHVLTALPRRGLLRLWVAPRPGSSRCQRLHRLRRGTPCCSSGRASRAAATCSMWSCSGSPRHRLLRGVGRLMQALALVQQEEGLASGSAWRCCRQSCGLWRHAWDARLRTSRSSWPLPPLLRLSVLRLRLRLLLRLLRRRDGTEAAWPSLPWRPPAVASSCTAGASGPCGSPRQQWQRKGRQAPRTAAVSALRCRCCPRLSRRTPSAAPAPPSLGCFAQGWQTRAGLSPTWAGTRETPWRSSGSARRSWRSSNLFGIEVLVHVQVPPVHFRRNWRSPEVQRKPKAGAPKGTRGLATKLAEIALPLTAFRLPPSPAQAQAGPVPLQSRRCVTGTGRASDSA